MGQNCNIIDELKEMKCEIMTIRYENCGVLKEFTGPKEEVIEQFKKIQDNPKKMKLIEIRHFQG